jgi:NAD(P)-dependent dehydrogenase (short-subunit alcohol dehydrogenase family)
VEAASQRRLNGKVAIVTGAGSRGPGVGTGKAMAILFAREGARVALVDLFPERAEETLSTIQDEGGDAFVLAADVTVEEDCERVVRDAVERYSRLDILVNNVATNEGFGPLHEVDGAMWDHVLVVNLKSVVLMCKHALPVFASGGGGSIVNISSVAALISAGGTEAYSASKAGMLRLSADLAVAYGRQGVRVNAILPGGIDTPMVAGQQPGHTERFRRLVPLGITGNAWDVAWAAVYLASDEARFVTGTFIPVDGGFTQLNAAKGYALASE